MVTDGGSAGDASEARAELWRRYDAGALDAAELDARLALVDRAGDDPAAIADAVEGPAPLGTRWWGRRAVLGGAAVVAGLLFGVGAWALVTDDGGDNGNSSGGSGNGGVGSGATVVPLPMPLPVPPMGPLGPGQVPAIPPCPELEEAIDLFEQAGGADETAANSALLSDPPAVPDGYAITDEDPIAPGTDPNIAMAVNAGNPPPIEIIGRDLAGPLLVTMRAFRYASVEDADAAGLNVLNAAVCAYDMERFTVPDRPEIIGSVVSGPIPTTAFAGFRLGDRRFTVSVPAASDDAADLEAAQQLAGLVASLELDAARTAPPPG